MSCCCFFCLLLFLHCEDFFITLFNVVVDTHGNVPYTQAMARDTDIIQKRLQANYRRVEGAAAPAITPLPSPPPGSPRLDPDARSPELEETDVLLREQDELDESVGSKLLETAQSITVLESIWQGSSTLPSTAPTRIEQRSPTHVVHEWQSGERAKGATLDTEAGWAQKQAREEERYRLVQYSIFEDYDDTARIEINAVLKNMRGDIEDLERVRVSLLERLQRRMEGGSNLSKEETEFHLTLMLLSQMRAKVTMTDEEVERLEKRILEEKAAVALAIEESAPVLKSETAADEDMKAAIEMVNKERAELREAEAELDSATIHFAAMQAEYARKAAELEAERASAAEAILGHTAELEELRKDIIQKEGALKHLVKDEQELARDMAEQAGDLTSLEQELQAQKDAGNKAIEELAEAQRTLDSATQSIEHLTNQCQELATRRGKAKRDKKKLLKLINNFDGVCVFVLFEFCSVVVLHRHPSVLLLYVCYVYVYVCVVMCVN